MVVILKDTVQIFIPFLNFKQAVTEMSDYLVQIRKKPGVWGELTTDYKKINQSNLQLIHK